MKHLGLLAGFTGGGGGRRGGGRRCRGGRPLAGLPLGRPVGALLLGEALDLERLGDLEELVELLLGHVDLAVVHEVQDVLHILGGDSPENSGGFVMKGHFERTC